MTRAVGGGLARVTIVAPRRRIDVALPEQVPVAELMAGLLRNAGEELADEGQAHGGWELRRGTGGRVDLSSSLGAQDLRDGEVLHLVPRQAEWPEMDYDDVVDAIATSARRQSRSWGGDASRRAGLAVAVGGLLLALGLTLTTGPSWSVPGGVALGLAVLALLAAVASARALGDSASGAVLGLVAMPAALAGGLVVTLGDRPLSAVGPAQFLAGSVALAAVSLLLYAGVADRTQWPVAGVLAGLLGAAGAGLAATDSMDAVDAAAVLVTVVVAFTPAAPLIAIRLGKLPVPALPTTAEELLADAPVVPRPRVQARVRRSDELLTGMLLGGALVVSVAVFVLASGDRRSALVLVVLVAAASLLRARVFPAVRHRVPLLAAGLVGATVLALESLEWDPELRLAVVVPALVVVAGLVLAAARAYRDRPPGPYLGRVGDVLDVLVVVAVVPVTCVVIGLYGYVRGLYG